MGGLFLAAWRLVLKRAASDRLIVGAAFITLLLAAALLAAGPIYSEAVALSGLERTLEDAPARDSGLEVSGRIPLEDASSADDRVASGIHRVLGDGVAVYRSGTSDSYAVPEGEGRSADALLGSGQLSDWFQFGSACSTRAEISNGDRTGSGLSAEG